MARKSQNAGKSALYIRRKCLHHYDVVKGIPGFYACCVRANDSDFRMHNALASVNVSKASRTRHPEP